MNIYSLIFIQPRPIIYRYWYVPFLLHVVLACVRYNAYKKAEVDASAWSLLPDGYLVCAWKYGTNKALIIITAVFTAFMYYALNAFFILIWYVLRACVYQRFSTMAFGVYNPTLFTWCPFYKYLVWFAGEEDDTDA